MNLYDIDKSHCVSTEQKLLWNIQEILKKKESLFISKEESRVEEKEINNISKKNRKMNPCKACGEIHSSVGEMLACCRNKKKEGG